MAVSGAFRAGRGGFRAVRATERRRVGCGAALDGQRVVVGCGTHSLPFEGDAFFSRPFACKRALSLLVGAKVSEPLVEGFETLNDASLHRRVGVLGRKP